MVIGLYIKSGDLPCISGNGESTLLPTYRKLFLSGSYQLTGNEMVDQAIRKSIKMGKVVFAKRKYKF